MNGPRDPGVSAEAFLSRHEVALYSNPLDAAAHGYSDIPPFHPEEAYPEYPFGSEEVGPRNLAYAAVRECFRRLGLDAGRYGSPQWNPLGDLVRPGDRVLIKPNAVLDRHALGQDLYAIVTHPSVLRAVLDYVHIAQAGEGEITIADAPQFNCDFARYRAVTRIDALSEFYQRHTGRRVAILDLRRLTAENDGESGVVRSDSRKVHDGDPLGYRVVDLGCSSAFASLSGCDRIYGADYDRTFASRAHRDGRHEYCLARSVLAADVLVSVPKMKTHGKVGVTLNLKGMVGLNGDKNYIPHYRVGTPEEGGDEYPNGLDPIRRGGRRLQRALIDRLLVPKEASGEALYRRAMQVKQTAGRWLRRAGLMSAPTEATTRLTAGEWRGNDTAWRMTSDLIRIALFADAEGRIHATPQRRFFSIVDGIVAGEGDGPLEPTPRAAGVIAAGFHPVAVDVVVCSCMGMDSASLPQFRRHIGSPPPLGLALESIQVRAEREVNLAWVRAHAHPFEPPFGWRT